MTTNIKCASCEVACDSDIITCEICGLNAIHIQCLGIDPFHISVGKMSWKCDNCANVSIASLLSTILPKLDALSSDMSMVKNSITEMKQSNAPQRPSYLDALSKGVPKMNPFLDRRERLDSAASNRSERKKRKLKNQQENEATDFTVDLTETEDEDMRPKNDARTASWCSGPFTRGEAMVHKTQSKQRGQGTTNAATKAETLEDHLSASDGGKPTAKANLRRSQSGSGVQPRRVFQG